MNVPQPRLPRDDPRTVARDIPGLLDALFPNLVRGVVASLNRRALVDPCCEPVPLEQVQATTITRPMLFELAHAAAEQLLQGRQTLDWDVALDVAVKRQRRHFDAQVPSSLEDVDKDTSSQVARNLVKMLRSVQVKTGNQEVVLSPAIPGYQWIASGIGDFSLGTCLVEVKCARRNFAAADYRQVLMYWILSYLSALEKGTTEWSNAILINPRHCRLLSLSFSDLVQLLGGGKSKVELVELFASLIEGHKLQK